LGSAVAPATAEPDREPPKPGDIVVEFVNGDVSFPVALEFAPDGRLFVAERWITTQQPVSGTIRVMRPDGTLQARPFVTMTLASSTPYTEKGLLGLALDPSFRRNGYVYAYRTAPPDTGNAAEHGEILRYTAALSGADWVGTATVTLVDNLPVSPGCCHNGGIIHFGPDGKLYLSIGDNGSPENGQNLATRSAKLLRFNRDGTIPRDNPFAGRPGADRAIYAYGLRNVFGYAWHPRTGELYATENGPLCDDELNQIVPGGNYGWPRSEQEGRCVDPGPEYTAPLWVLNPTLGPTGAEFYTGDTIPAFQNDLFFGTWERGILYRTDVEEDPAAVTIVLENCGEPIVLDNHYALLDVETGPEGDLYFSCQLNRFPAIQYTGAIYRLTTEKYKTYLPSVLHP
ncbi:MAG TPA: PQQ-dependent sugar dehydrogenase, partial [Ardenticatenaceae bacterium]|nr:PQQ-dependent sugar dehydrogenase [Ardenticatenaceae bacterium]